MFRCGRFELGLAQPLVMGIVNVTNDSFSGDGLQGHTACAIEHGLRLLDEGAELLDIGGESSRPGAVPVSAEQEMARVLPVLVGLRDCGVPISVDTTKPEVMRAALDAGADMINDITALQTPGALAVVAASDCGICLMHMQGEPRTMQQTPQYVDVVAQIAVFFRTRVDAALAAGIAHDRLILDPGFGFGKTIAHNLTLLRRFEELRVDGLPLLAGLSRKSMLGRITGRAVNERVHASVAAALLAVQHGASIVRVHDVAATRDALAVLGAFAESAAGFD